MQPLEKWFRKRFPEMAKVWAALGDRAKTGSLIAEQYELPLMLNAELQAYADGLGLTLAYEIDRIGVFAERDGGELASKLEKVKSFVRQQANGMFGVPVIATQV